MLGEILVVLNVLLFSALIGCGAWILHTIRTMSAYKTLSASMLKHMDGGIALIDAADRFEFASPHFCELLRLDNPSIAGCEIAKLLPGDIYRMIMEYRVSEPDTGNRTLTQTVQFQGSHIQTTVFSVHSGKRGTRCVISLEDRTQQVLMEQQLSNRIDEIQFLLKTKETLLSNLSHELRTPLNAIVGLNHILEESQLTKRQHEIVSKIHVSADHLTSLLNDILDFSMLKNEKLTLNPSPFRLKDFLERITEKFSSAAEKKGIRILTNYRFDPDLCLRLDPLRMEQVLSNLLKNACEFTNVGFIRIRVCVLKEFQDTISLKFSVEDTGIGLSSEELTDVFTEFHQVEGNLTKTHQGSGLGLPICRSLVERMGGAIWAESKKGMGSTFFFTITAPKYYSSSDSGGQLIPVLHGRRQRILVVEDTQINYDVVEELLSKVNLCCEHAPSGPAALDMCGERDPSYYKVILMDIHMPMMDGYETSRKLKEMGISAPILALTATNMNRETLQKHGDLFETVILKPFKYTQLYSALRPYIEDRPVPSVPSFHQHSEESYSREDPYAGKKEAIENLGGSRALYEKHLAKFKKNYAEAGEQMESHLTSGDRNEARILAHSVKGLAGTLGLTYLARSAGDLESAITCGAPDLDCEMRAFCDRLAQVVDG